MRYMLFLLVMVILAPFVQAQEDIAWPPEAPQTLFGQNVEIIDMQLDGTTFQQARPVMVAEEYRAFVTADRRVFAWPDNFPNLAGGFSVVGSDLGIETSQFDVYFSSSQHPGGESDNRWRLDLLTGVYTRFNTFPTYIDTYCGPYPSRDSWHNGWVIITGVRKQQHLCYLETGQLSSPLPGEYLDWQIYNVRQSKGYVLLGGQRANASDDSRTLFAFDISNNQLLTVGEFMPVGEMLTGQLGDTLITLSTSVAGPPDPSVPNVTYVVDVLAQHILQVPSDGRYRANPPRLEYRTLPEDPDEMSCDIMTLDLLTENQISYTLNTFCFPERSGSDHREYYRVLHENGEQADVIRLDTTTGQSTVLFTGEVERITWISEDERYAAFVLDSNGKVDNPSRRRAEVYGSPDAQLVLLDLTDRSRLYETQAYPGGYSGDWLPGAGRVNEDWLVVSDTQTTQLLHIEEDHVTVKSVEGRVGRHLGGGWAMLWPTEILDEYGSVVSFSLYNLDTEEVIPVVDLGSHVEDYWLSDKFEYLGEGIFQVTIGYREAYWLGEIPPLYNLAVYQIRIEGWK